jgi:hypothetical protein
MKSGGFSPPFGMEERAGERRGTGSSAAPLLGPLPARPSRGEEAARARAGVLTRLPYRELRDPEGARVLAIAYAGANQWANVLSLAPRLLAYANASYPDSETRYGVAVLLAAASVEAGSAGKQLLSETVALLPQDPEKWTPDAKRAVKRALEASGDKAGLERLKQGLAPLGIAPK